MRWVSLFLQPLSSSNVIVKYADDTYVIIPASNHSTCNSEIQHFEGWAYKHNLKLIYKKSCEVPFVRPRCNRHTDVPPPAVKGIDRVQHITALGVTLSHNFSITKHIDTVMNGRLWTYSLRSSNTTGSWYASGLSADSLLINCTGQIALCLPRLVGLC